MTDFTARRDYERGRLLEADVVADPLEQFKSWYDIAANSPDVLDANAMTLATSTSNGAPSGRIVLLRELDTGFVFFTNYESRKGHELDTNPHAALTFFWPALERQVRIEGTVAKVSKQESDAYFATRPYRSKLGAHASQQSTVIASADDLENEMKALEQRFPESDNVPRPQTWGGYRVTPSVMEFWQGRRSRLHDRLRYRHNGKAWTIERLAP